MNGILPYKIEYSDGDQSCTKCHGKIRTDHIQIAIMKQSDEDDCYNPEWFHFKCFFQTRRPSTEAGFDGFALLRYTDQLDIQVELGVVDRRCLQSPDAKVPDFGIDYAKQNRDACTECEQGIPKGAVRIMKVAYDVNQNTAFDGKATWYHVECFARKRSEHGWLESAEKLPGFRRLKDADKEAVKRQFPVVMSLEKQIEAQNEEYFKVYDGLIQLSRDEQVNLLKKNLQFVPNTDYEIRHHLTDIIVFGALHQCDQCRTCSLVFKNTKYVCARQKDWAKCGNTVDEPRRMMPRVPPEMLAKYPFLKPPESVQARAVHPFQWTDDEGNDLVFGVYKHPKLFNMTFVIVGKLSKTKEAIEEVILKLGGKIVEKVDKKLTAVLSNRDEVQKMGTLMKQAKRYNIQVVSEEFLTAIDTTEDPFLYIISESLCDWGGDPYARTEQNDVKSRRETVFYTKSLPEKLTYKWKDGSAVDPECGLADNAHVYCGDAGNHKDVEYSVVLGLVDIESNKNSYYRMQLLESDEIKLYWVFEAWGRISTSIGSKRLKNYGRLEEALAQFNSTYQEKTGHSFGKKKTTKLPNKFYHLDIEFCAKKKLPSTFVETKLPKTVYELMQMLFDVKRFEDMMFGFDLDLKQMPLGKISSKQIHLAMEVLGHIARMIEHNDIPSKLQAASNRFYTMIPHAFSVKRPAIIDSLEIVNEKNEMLESLLNMELIYGFLDEEYGEKSNPLDACYLKLKNEIVPVDKNSPEYQMLCDIARDTHCPTHLGYALEVLEVFKLKREGEDERFRTVEHLDRHRLLWHGSRLMNFVSILTNGLKIAPPEAPVSGYMFGKGVYFADMVSKSANYCYTDPNNNIGLMLLCKVALGQQRKLTQASAVVDIPNANEQSVKALGAFFPFNWSSINGVKINTGAICRGNAPTALWYNEYIVYNEAQVKVEYLFKMKFHFKP
ncbi:poly [ADP-ribose] polymerase-like [Sitodiplosis mosellana]|uniref:poly [ADP-ribose] polymerase-like n=1 Tax=Sitodiplosis mosellana TaxID=263140 RepID=UPI0024443608|nr:poly [ADP-ribose] polymerase-like [Sitodiplosis mosellana]